MTGLSMSDKLVVLQYAIIKYDSENLLKEKLREIVSPKEIERGIDTLIGTQKVRRIGADTLQNNVSHTGELPEVPEHLRSVVDNL
jgi:hypothetical protein